MIKLANPNISEEAIQKVGEVLRSGNLVQGQYVREFEASLEKYIGVKHAIVVSSGTAALHLSLVALGIGKGDEVIVPAFTFPATVNVVEIVGATPVLVDITLDDFCIDVSKIEEAITPRTKAIMPVHEFGMMADMQPLMEIADKYGLIVVEDAACALGSEYDNKKAGTFGKIGCFSFHPRKAITTGEGGAIVTDDDYLADQLKSLRNHGIKHNNGKIDFVYPGLNYRMTDFQAVLGLSQLKTIENDINNREALGSLYSDHLNNIDWIVPPLFFKNRRMVFQTYHVLLHKKINRSLLIDHLINNGVESNYGAYSICNTNFYKNKYSHIESGCTNASYAYDNGLALPMACTLTKKQINKIVLVLSEYRF